jgi:hypothetical protein
MVEPGVNGGKLVGTAKTHLGFACALYCSAHVLQIARERVHRSDNYAAIQVTHIYIEFKMP